MLWVLVGGALGFLREDPKLSAGFEVLDQMPIPCGVEQRAYADDGITALRIYVGPPQVADVGSMSPPLHYRRLSPSPRLAEHYTRVTGWTPIEEWKGPSPTNRSVSCIIELSRAADLLLADRIPATEEIDISDVSIDISPNEKARIRGGDLALVKLSATCDFRP